MSEERREVRDERLEPDFKHVRVGPKWSGEFGPVYEVPLIEDLPLGHRELKPGEVPFTQAMPGRGDLDACQRKLKHTGGTRIVAGFEVLLHHFMTLNAACLKFLDAERSEHLAVRLSDGEMAAVEEIRKAVVR